MKKTLSLLGSTGSIGKSTLKIINKNQKIFLVNLLTTNNNINLLLKQAIKYNVKNVIIKS